MQAQVNKINTYPLELRLLIWCNLTYSNLYNLTKCSKAKVGQVKQALGKLQRQGLISKDDMVINTSLETKSGKRITNTYKPVNEGISLSSYLMQDIGIDTEHSFWERYL